MIGQKKLIQRIDQIIDRRLFPHFCAIIGAAGSGKRTLVKHIIDKTGYCLYYLPDNKVDTIRTAIDSMYRVSTPTMFILTDVDDMSVSAKNVLLKVTEEYPDNVYILMTVCNEVNLLNTIVSRATTIYMEPYSPVDILEYATTVSDDFNPDIIGGVCEVPGNVDLLINAGVDEFYSYVEKVVDNIAYVGLSNVFKMTNKIALKSGADGYDLRLFLIAFQRVCFNHLMEYINDKEEREYWSEAIRIAAQTISALTSITGINKSALLDTFIVKIRKVWS